MTVANLSRILCWHNKCSAVSYRLVYCILETLGLFSYNQNFLSILKFTYAHKFIEKEIIVRFLVTMRVVLLQKESTHCYKQFLVNTETM